MTPFQYRRVAEIPDAIRAGADPGAQYLAGGTVLLDLMKLGAIHPSALVQIGDLRGQHGAITADADGLHIGALARMSELGDSADTNREWPAIAQSIRAAASAQLRNMASIAGTLLQRTRCTYFRDPSWKACNKRNPGSGCAAIDGSNRLHAVLGTSAQCIASYPGDLAPVLAAFGATVDLISDVGPRTIPFEGLHRLPGDRPDLETDLRLGEIITAIHVPRARWARRSLYLKIRDRDSYAFALASAAIGLDMEGGMVREVRIGLGGVATKPWRSHEAEGVLKGQPLTEETASRAAQAAFAAAHVHTENEYKPELGRRTLVRALLAAAELED
jgi:xanthine dehydrogenase YagS FAD-binding subunit